MKKIGYILVVMVLMVSCNNGMLVYQYDSNVNMMLSGGDTASLKYIEIDVKGVSFKMIGVVGGTFLMGQEGVATPVHSVTLSDYYIGETEVTQELWTVVMGNNPSYPKSDNLPVEFVSWNDCQEFIGKLNKLTRKTFALPTEAQWEYAARGGNRSRGYLYSGSNDIDAVAWSAACGSGEAHPVGTKQANELGIYDMSGNVWEWCNDWYGSYSLSSQTDPSGPSSGSHRVLRGGGYNWNTQDCCTAYRVGGAPDSDYSSGWSPPFGLRLVLHL